MQITNLMRGAILRRHRIHVQFRTVALTFGDVRNPIERVCLQ
jgi:hypothetical protein